MNRTATVKIIVLFFLFFSFQWSSQYAAARLAEGGNPLFYLLLYGGFCLRALVWVEILREKTLISAYSITSLSYLLLPVLSMILLGEAYRKNQLMGGIMIFCGIILFATGEQRAQEEFS